MGRAHRTVRVDEELLAELERLARERLVPEIFAEQVEAGLRLLVNEAEQEKVARAAALVAADRDRAERTFRRLHSRPQP